MKIFPSGISWFLLMKSKILALLLILILLASYQPAFAQSQADYPIYVIQPGDSLGYIASLFGTTVNELIRANALANPDMISPGQKLVIPGLDGVHGTLEVLTTKLGETFSDLEIEYGLDLDQIIKINKITSPTQIFVGSQVIVAQSEEKKPIVPVRIIGEQETALETAVITGRNPQTLALINRKAGLLDFLPNSAVFDLQTDTTESVSLYAPILKNVEITPLPLVQGDTVSIQVTSKKPVKLSGVLNGYPLHFMSGSDGMYYALQGIHAMAEPGLVDFDLSGTNEDGSTFTYSQKVLLNPGIFDEDPPLVVDPATIDPTVTEPENELVTSLISTVTPTRYWTGVFQSPAEYQYYNSLFGTRRTYNDNPKVTFHAGVDFGGGITLPIYAPADGKVVMARSLAVRGNTVFIDHGWGVYSGFFHQNSLKVKVGDFVTKGQVIGEVGNTGRVNGAEDYYGAGAHLHWEVWVNGVQVDPLKWLNYEYP